MSRSTRSDGRAGRILLAATVVAALLALAPPRAAADERKEEARALHEKGLAHYRRQEYRKAIAAFDRAYTLSGAPGILYNIAQAYRLQGDCRRAIQYYEEYMLLAPDGGTIRQARGFVAELKPECGDDDAGGGDGAGDDGDGAGGDGDDGDDGGDGDRAAGGSRAVEGAGRRSPTTEEPGARGRRRLALALVAGGAVLAGTGTYYAIRADGAAADVSALWRDGGYWDDHYRGIEADGQRAALAAQVLLGVGAAAIAGGIVVVLLPDREEAPAAPAVAIGARPGGATLDARWTF